ncbi:MAG: transporter, ATP-binding protein [Chlorobi bacterium]|nr:transporter, ATP-binding protein [Chlorobiota bacterium]
MSSVSITIEGLEKIYRSGKRSEPEIHALKPLWLDIQPGEVFGLLGPNGAGKTTLVKLLLGIVSPSSGSAQIEGRRIGTTSSKEIVGYLPESHRYPLYLTGRGVLDYFGHLSGLDTPAIRRRGDVLLEQLNMTKWKGTKVKKYSKGMMQRLGLAQALLNDPRVIFLDEPTDGVDPVGRKEIRDLIGGLRAEGKTIFLNSHLLSEVELISDRVAILNKGELVRIGTVKELTESSNHYRVEVAEEQAPAFAAAIARFTPRDLLPNGATIMAADLRALNEVIDHLRSQGLLIVSVNPVRQTLENLFMDIVQGGAR